MKLNAVPFTSALCWTSFWLGSVLVGSSWLYAKLKGVEFLLGISRGWGHITSPDSTVALMLSIGTMLIAIGLLFVPLYYSAVLVSAFIRILTRQPIRI